MGQLIRDLQYAARGLMRSPMFTAVALLSIALGIGANTAIFTLVDEVLLRVLPVKNPEQLVLFNGARNHYGSNSGGNMLSFPMYEDFRDNFVEGATTLPRVSQAVPNPAPDAENLLRHVRAPADGDERRHAGRRRPDRARPGELVSGTYFQVLGVGAAIGRVITPDDDKTRGDGSWRSSATTTGAPASARTRRSSGRRITINNYTLTIIGVSQAGFDGVDIGYVPRVRVPVMMKAQMTPNWDDVDNRRSRWVNVFGRLKPGVTLEQAKSPPCSRSSTACSSRKCRCRRSAARRRTRARSS